MNSMKGLIISSVLTTAIFIVAVMSFFGGSTIEPGSAPQLAGKPAQNPAAQVEREVRQIAIIDQNDPAKPANDNEKPGMSLADLINADDSDVPALSSEIAVAPAEETLPPEGVSNVVTGSVQQPTPPAAVQTPKVAPVSASGGSVTVRPGDTLYKISRHTGISVPALIAANNISDPSKIKVGDVIKLP